MYIWGTEYLKSPTTSRSSDSHIPPIPLQPDREIKQQTLLSNLFRRFNYFLGKRQKIRLVFPWRMSYHKSPLSPYFFILIPQIICNCFPNGTAAPVRDQEYHTLQSWLGKASRWHQVECKVLCISDMPEEWPDTQVIGLRKGDRGGIGGKIKYYLYLTTTKISKWFASDSNTTEQALKTSCKKCNIFQRTCWLLS